MRALRGAAARHDGVNDAGRFEIDYRLDQKEREFQEAILLANSVRIETLADDGVVVPGQPVQRDDDRGQPRRRRRHGEAGAASAASTATCGLHA